MVSKLNIEALMSTLKIVDEKCVERAVNAINTANRVAIYALSGSLIAAQDALFKFDRLGINCRLYDTPHSQILSAATLNAEDAAIFLSYSGEQKISSPPPNSPPIAALNASPLRNMVKTP
jgi:DNA-binding MurR/RpiR family transcriptional regulator